MNKRRTRCAGCRRKMRRSMQAAAAKAGNEGFCSVICLEAFNVERALKRPSSGFEVTVDGHVAMRLSAIFESISVMQSGTKS